MAYGASFINDKVAAAKRAMRGSRTANTPNRSARRYTNPAPRAPKTPTYRASSFTPNYTARRTGPATGGRSSYSGGGGYSGGGYSGGGGGYSGGGGGGSAMPMTADIVEPELTMDDINDWSDKRKEDWVSDDATYTAQRAALEQELKNLLADIALQRTNYNTDYTSALENLGWDAEEEAWDPNNLLGGYGQSYDTQQNDFANRGMLDSSAYARALDNLTTSFNKQKDDLGTARSNFFSELDLQKSNAQKSNNQDLQRARADAIARRAAREGIV